MNDKIEILESPSKSFNGNFKSYSDATKNNFSKPKYNVQVNKSKTKIWKKPIKNNNLNNLHIGVRTEQ